ncbi:hypothetical protein IAT38_005484 [Cryptococcus sp. DSM 104549]
MSTFPPPPPATPLNPLPLLIPHLPILILTTLGCYGLQALSHVVAPRVVARYEEFDRKTRIGWASHVVSTVHALTIIPLAIQSAKSEILKADPLFGYDPWVGEVVAFTAGYFVWDTIDSYLHSTPGFVLHGAACLMVFLFSFRPFLAGFGAPFVLWELSTPFLNVHWFMDKAGWAERYPKFALGNSLMFMLVFFLVRIVYGAVYSVGFLQVMWDERERIPVFLHVIYCTGDIALMGLNCLWFSKMVRKMVERFSARKEPVVRVNGIITGHPHGVGLGGAVVKHD